MGVAIRNVVAEITHLLGDQDRLASGHSIF